MSVCRLSLLIAVLFAPLSMAQAFEVETLDGQRIDLDRHTQGGDWTLVFLWSLDCVPCETQKPAIDAFARERTANRVQVVGLAIDGVEWRTAVARRVSGAQPVYPNYLVLADVFDRQFNDTAGRGYRGLTPTFLLYRPGGELVGVHSGPIDLELVRQLAASTPSSG